MEYIEANLSRYAASMDNGQEIISECFSSVFGEKNNEFALDFLEECDSIILKR